jgi:hypothetical protein
VESTTLATRTISAAGGNYNAVGSWDEGAVPTSSDDIVCRSDGTSGNLTVNVLSSCKSIDFTYYSHLFTISNVFNVYGSVTLASAMSITVSGKFARWLFMGAPSGATIRSNGKNFGGVVTFNGTGDWTLQDAMATSGVLTLNSGSLSDGGFNLTAAAFISDVDATRVLTLTGTVALTGASGNLWYIRGTGFTLNASSSTITMAGSGTVTGKWFGAATLTGLAYGNFSITSATTSGFVLLAELGASYKMLSVVGTNALWFYRGTTHIFTGFSFTSGETARITLRTDSAGQAATISISSGDIAIDYADIRDLSVSGGARVFAGQHSIDQRNNSGWIWQDGLAA